MNKAPGHTCLPLISAAAMTLSLMYYYYYYKLNEGFLHPLPKPSLSYHASHLVASLAIHLTVPEGQVQSF